MSCLTLGACIALGTAGARAADWYTGAAPVSAPHPNDLIVSVDTSTTVSSQGSYFANVSITGAATRTLTDSGVRVRVEGLVGRYNYLSNGSAMRGDQVEGSALAGYEWVGRNASIAGFIGLNVRADRTPTVLNPAPGFSTTAGVKGEAQFYVKPSEDTYIQANSSYSTDRNAYYARLRGGVLVFGSAYVGPEFVVLGDNTYGQWRVGGHLSGLQVGPLAFGVSLGYARDRALKDGFYSTADVRAVF